MPILLRGLDLADPSIRSHIINTLSNNIEVTPAVKDAVSMYASTLVLAMLKNCMYSEMRDPVRRLLVQSFCLKYSMTKASTRGGAQIPGIATRHCAI
jgi:hypothetical protein